MLKALSFQHRHYALSYDPSLLGYELNMNVGNVCC